MPLPAVLARVILAALRKFAPKSVGAALAALGVFEAADLAREVWRTFFGRDAEEVAEGARHPELAPAELLALLRGDAVDLGVAAGDVIEEETLLRDLVRAELRDPAADLSIQILPAGDGGDSRLSVNHGAGASQVAPRPSARSATRRRRRK